MKDLKILIASRVERPQAAPTRHHVAHQALASRIAAKLGDVAHRGLYAFLARWYEATILETALQQTLRSEARKPGAYFQARVKALGGPLPVEAYAKRKRTKPKRKQLTLTL